MKILTNGFSSKTKKQFLFKQSPDENFEMITDSYKIGHGPMYPENTEKVYSYFESRNGARYPETQFFGLQYLIKRHLQGSDVISQEGIDRAARMYEKHFQNEKTFDKEKWQELLNDHGGRLPIEIKAIAEGSTIPTGNVLFTVVNTDPKYKWLTSHIETILTHVWYASEIATKGHTFRKFLTEKLQKTSDLNPAESVGFMFHDFGFRGATSLESAGYGGMAHLLNFIGTDTVPALMDAEDFYNAKEIAGFSVNASEHSVATAEGEAGEEAYFDRMLDNYPDGVISIVSDSYDINRFITEYVPKRKDKIIQRHLDGKNPIINRVVFRPDSKRFDSDTNAKQCLWVHQELAKTFGTSTNSKGFKVLNPAVGVIMGDGNKDEDIFAIYNLLEKNGFSVENCVIGQGGGLLQDPKRDNQRFAFKSSAQMRDGKWFDVQKNPLDKSKASKTGHLKLISRLAESKDELKNSINGKIWETINQHDPRYETAKDEMETVFKDGELLVNQTWKEITERTQQAIDENYDNRTAEETLLKIFEEKSAKLRKRATKIDEMIAA